MLQKLYAKFTEKEKKILYVAAAFVILAIFDALFMRPVASKIKKIDAEVKEKTDTLKRDIRILSYKNRILKEQEDFRIYGTGEEKTEEEIIAGFLKTIENLVSESKINLVKLNPGESKPRKGFIEYYANLECDGTWEDMVTFMHKIETTNELLKISKVNISGKKTSPDQVSASMTIIKLIIDPKSIGVQAQGEDSELVPQAEALSQKMMQEYQGQPKAKTKKAPGGVGGEQGGEDGGSMAIPAEASPSTDTAEGRVSYESGAPSAGGAEEGAGSEQSGTGDAGETGSGGGSAGGSESGGAAGASGGTAEKPSGGTGGGGGKNAAGSEKNSKEKSKEPNPKKLDATKDSGPRWQVEDIETLWLRLIGKDPNKVKAERAKKAAQNQKVEEPSEEDLKPTLFDKIIRKNKDEE